MKTIAILGSTGSIGTQALDICRRHPDRYRVVALTARGNKKKLFDHIQRLVPRRSIHLKGSWYLRNLLKRVYCFA